MATLLIDKIDDQLRNDFKSECYKRGLSMRDVIIRLMALELENNFSCLIDKKKGKKKK